MTGSALSKDFPVTPGAFQTDNKSTEYHSTGFVTKLNSSGTALVYSTYLGGSGSDYSAAIAVDGSGFAYVTGYAGSADFPVTLSALPHTAGATGAFLTKLNTAGSAPLYSTLVTGSVSGYGGGDAIALDAIGNAYIAGAAGPGGVPITAGAYQTTDPSYYGSSNAFVTKLALGQPIAQFTTTLVKFPDFALGSSDVVTKSMKITNVGGVLSNSLRTPIRQTGSFLAAVITRAGKASRPARVATSR